MRVRDSGCDYCHHDSGLTLTLTVTLILTLKAFIISETRAPFGVSCHLTFMTWLTVIKATHEVVRVNESYGEVTGETARVRGAVTIVVSGSVTVVFTVGLGLVSQVAAS